MEVNKGRYYKIKWFWNIVSNGLFLFGLRNRLAKLGFDLDPYYWVEEGFTDYEIPKIKGSQNDYVVTNLSLDEIHSIRKNIIGSGPVSDLPIFHDKQLGIGIKHKGDIAAFMLIELNDFWYHKRRIRLKDNEAYLFHMYTFEKHRGKNLAPYLRYHSYLMLKNLGKDRIFSITQYFNKSSKNFKKKLHAKNRQLFINISLFNKVQNYVLLRDYTTLAPGIEKGKANYS